jgi:N-acetylglucosamine-6-phosphate deacetylase
MVTLAPELPGGLDAIAEIVDLGGTVAVGHTDADYAVTCRAIASGARVATHLFNGMPPLHHRRPGPVGALLEADGVVIELINDGVHVHPAIVRCVAGAVGTGRVALVTDAIAAAGMDDGEYRLGPVAVRVTAGVARVADGDSLAGSTLTMDAAVRNAVTLGLSPLAAFHAASLTPARALGIADRVGRIEVGLDADLVLLDDRLAVQRVMAKGAWVATS